MRPGAITINADSDLDIDALVEFDTKAFSLGGINPFSFIPLPFGDLNSSILDVLIGNNSVADRFKALGTSLTNLAQNPASPILKTETLASLDSILTFLADAPLFADYVAPLVAARDQLTRRDAARRHPGRDSRYRRCT